MVVMEFQSLPPSFLRQNLDACFAGPQLLARLPRACPTTVRFKIVDMAHDIDSTVFRTFERVSDTQKRINTMRHHNSVFHDLLKHVPWNEFDKLVDKHKANYRSRTLKAKGHFIAMLFGQLAGAGSLRDIEAGLMSQKARLYHLGGCTVPRSTLADANATRPAAFFESLFAHLAGCATRSTRRHMKDARTLLDATQLKLTSLGKGWLESQNQYRAVKLHIAYDPVGSFPLEAIITNQSVHDIIPAKAMPIEPGMTYVFDMAYYDFGWWAALHDQGCRFVTRFKSHTWLRDVEERAVEKGSNILSDRIGHLPERMARSRKNPMSAPMREITVRISTGKIIRIATNDVDAPATEIADLNKERWQIELFFKWIKQNLKIRHFLGTSENAVRIQIFIALIAYLLLRFAQATQTTIEQPKKFASLIRMNLMHRRSIQDLERPTTHHPPNDPRQAEMEFLKC